MITAGRLIIIAAILLFTLSTAAASPIIFVVRHAEKAATTGTTLDLSTAGQERAEGLARMLKDAEITAIFTTEFKRTLETAAPTAKGLHVSPTVVPANHIPAIVEKLRRLKGNGLVVGTWKYYPGFAQSARNRNYP